MIGLLCFFLRLLASPFKSASRLEAENAAFRHQLIVLQREVRGRAELTNGDRLFFILLYRWFPSILKAVTIIRPETPVRWHRAGFRRYWRWKSRNPGGRPPIRADLRALIRRMSIEKVLWGAPRIQGELLKLGFTVAQSTVAKYMARNDDPSGQRWGTFLRNHAPHIAAMDLERTVRCAPGGPGQSCRRSKTPKDKDGRGGRSRHDLAILEQCQAKSHSKRHEIILDTNTSAIMPGQHSFSDVSAFAAVHGWCSAEHILGRHLDMIG